jgi:FixJ family two-component response regulator
MPARAAYGRFVDLPRLARSVVCEAKRGACEAAMSSPAKPAPGAEEQRMNSTVYKNVFIVDDEESIGRSLSRLLILEGYRVYFFPSARGFLDSVPSDATGCLISDIYMPGLDGFELQQRMNQLGFRLPIIFMSAHAQAGDRETAMTRGALGFLVKPFDEKSLLDLLSRAFRN